MTPAKAHGRAYGPLARDVADSEAQPTLTSYGCL
jgi:hypothetical protein